MQYRTFGKLEWKPSALGFGAMRLPTISEKSPGRSTHQMDDIDEPQAIELIRRAIDLGINYVDTARPYHQGESERVVGQALQGGYRNKVKLATKLSVSPKWIRSADDFDPFLDDQLKRLQTDHIDFYLLHALQKTRWPALREMGVLDWAERAIADGRIGQLGFSFHDEYPIFEEIVDAYDWTFCQILYNYMDIEFQAGTKGLNYAASKGLAVSVMEPLRGGQLARTPPESVARIWDGAAEQRTPVDWALRWLWHQPEVSIVLSGMSSLEQVEQNVRNASEASVDCLSAEAWKRFDDVREAFRALSPIPCTDCKYCQPCPQDIPIPDVFALYNEKVMYGEDGQGFTAFSDYGASRLLEKECVACGQCEAACPQQIKIIDRLRVARAYLQGEAA